jgi:hypothetical protein
VPAGRECRIIHAELNPKSEQWQMRTRFARVQRVFAAKSARIRGKHAGAEPDAPFPRLFADVGPHGTPNK